MEQFLGDFPQYLNYTSGTTTPSKRSEFYFLCGDATTSGLASPPPWRAKRFGFFAAVPSSLMGKLNPSLLRTPFVRTKKTVTCTRRQCPARSPRCWPRHCSARRLSGKRWRDFLRASWRDSTAASSSLRSCTKVTPPLTCHHLSADGIKLAFASRFTPMDLYLYGYNAPESVNLANVWSQNALYWHRLGPIFAMYISPTRFDSKFNRCPSSSSMRGGQTTAWGPRMVR